MKPSEFKKCKAGDVVSLTIDPSDTGIIVQKSNLVSLFIRWDDGETGWYHHTNLILVNDSLQVIKSTGKTRRPFKDQTFFVDYNWRLFEIGEIVWLEDYEPGEGETARIMGAFAGFDENKNPVIRLIKNADAERLQTYIFSGSAALGGVNPSIAKYTYYREKYLNEVAADGETNYKTAQRAAAESIHTLKAELWIHETKTFRLADRNRAAAELMEIVEQINTICDSLNND